MASKNIKIISWNVNGLRSAYRKGFLQFLNRARPHILCLQETKSKLEQLPEDIRKPKGYDVYFSEAHRAGYSGVATFVRHGIAHDPEKIGRGIGITRFDSEGRFLITEHEEFLLYNIYFPSGTTGEARQNFKYKFLDSVSEHIETLSRKDRERLIVCGDFNICHKEIDIHHPKEATRRKLTGFLPEERRWLDSFLALGLVDSFRSLYPRKSQAYTWWSFRANSRTKNLGWRIDYVFVAARLNEKLKGAKILADCDSSDHAPVEIILRFSK